MKNLKNLVLAAMFMAIGIMLPFLTGQLKQLGNMLLPMHLPVLLCSFICGWKFGFVIGAVLPVLRSAMFGMPVMYPSAVSMAFELATYGFVAGFVSCRLRGQTWKNLYVSLILALIIGRAVWGIVQTLMLGTQGFGFGAFFAGAVVNAVPGILIQLLLVPAIVMALKKNRLY